VSTVGCVMKGTSLCAVIIIITNTSTSVNEDDDELPSVIGENEGNCVWRGSRKTVGSSFHRQGAAYRKDRLVIFKEDEVGGRARVTIDEERVLW